jgi:hypothetical protein
MRERKNVIMLARNKNTSSDRDESHAEGFRDLENDICELVRAANLALVAKEADNVGDGDGDLTLFTIEQFAKMAKDLKRKYYARWDA